ncbi:esterase 1 [Pholiota molesta]|nr:esterase 1 [Pholiota molesta]
MYHALGGFVRSDFLKHFPISYLVTALFAFVAGSPQVQLRNTTLTGVTSAGVEFFGGENTFAKPPVGVLRLQPPDLPPEEISEDCLQLNIFRPSGISADANLPIMFWIFGATGLVSKSVARGTPVIFVSVNYRLGPLGFPQGAESSAKNITNLGLRDIIAGLQWVQSNINFFGGDKSKVTMFGESAGATIIAESTAFLPTFAPERGEGAWQVFIGAFLSHRLGVSDTSWFPNIDGPGGLLPDVPSKLISAERLPMIIGNNRDEGTLFTPQDVNSTDQIRDTFIGMSIPTFGLNTQYKRLAAMFGDLGFQACRRKISRSMSASGIKIFGYQFTDPNATVPPTVPVAPGSLGVTHASELSYVFGPEIFGRQDYWISFAVSLDPNDGKGDKRNALEVVSDDYRAEQMEFVSIIPIF